MRSNIGLTFASAISLVAGLGAASAADMAVKARPMVAPVAYAYNWSGCYVGASGGGKWARPSDTVFVPAATGLAGPTAASTLGLGSRDADTWLAGGQAGCNWQTGQVVFGVEGDAHAQRWRRTELLSGVLPPLFIPGDIFELRSDWQASIRGRIGYAWDRTLLYATGGVAFTEVRAYANWIPVITGGVSFPGVITSESRTLVGATVGAGVEQAITNNFTLGVEGRYTWYGNESFNAGLLPTQGLRSAGPFTFSPTTRDIKLDTAEVLVKANWKFWSY